MPATSRTAAHESASPSDGRPDRRPRPQYAVVTATCSLGRWLRSRTEAFRIAEAWRARGNADVRVLDHTGAEVQP